MRLSMKLMSALQLEMKSKAKGDRCHGVDQFCNIIINMTSNFNWTLISLMFNSISINPR